jgi:hypothetical protein
MPKYSLAWVLVAVWIGCTSTNNPDIGALGDGGADAKATNKDGGTGSTDSGGGTDAKPAKDSGTGDETGATPLGPCTPTAGGLPCDTGKIYCGATNCDMATEECCVDITTGSSTCMATGTCTKAPMACDEARDCNPGEICCFSASGTTPTGATCQDATAGCGLGDFTQSCRSDDECAGSGSCIKQTCKTYKIQTCAKIPVDPCP